MIEKVTLHLNEASKLVPAKGMECTTLNPKAMMLYACADCAGRTTLMILKKERVEPLGFEITVSGEMSTDEVKAETVFLSFHVLYNIQCASGNEQAKASHAALLAHEKFCGMIQMMRKIAPVTHEIAIVSTQPAKA